MLKAGFAPAAIGDLLTPIVGASDIRFGSAGFMGLLFLRVQSGSWQKYTPLLAGKHPDF
jgi:hypothetical protein